MGCFAIKREGGLPDNIKLLKKGITLYNRKKEAEAEALFLNVIDSDPLNPEANYYLGLIYSKSQQYVSAEKNLKVVVDSEVNFLYTQQSRMILGYIYFKLKKYDLAELQFLKVKDTNLNIIQVYAALSAVYHYMKDKQKAIYYAERAYNIDQLNLNAKNTYGYLLCDYELDINRGIALLREVVRIKPDNPAYLDSLGWAYYKKGDKKGALACIRKSLELSKENSEVLDHLGVLTNG